MTKPKLLLPSIGRKVLLVRLLNEKFDVFTADYDPESPGVIEAAQGRRISQNSTNQWLLKTCKEHGIQAVLPVRNDDCCMIGRAKRVLSRCNVMALVSPPKTVAICRDKLLLARELPELAVPTAEAPLMPFPIMAKLRFGAGSQFAARIFNIKDYARYAWPDEALIFQRLLSGPEFTVDAFCDKAGRLVQSVTRCRESVINGQMDRGRVDETPKDLVNAMEELTSCLRFLGPFNAQFILDSSSRYRLIDVNPRFAGGYPLTHAAGADFVELLYQLVKGQKLTPREVTAGVRASSYTAYEFSGRKPAILRGEQK